MAYKEKDTKKWSVQWFETTAKGEKKKRKKRGFETKREALECERQKKFGKLFENDTKSVDLDIGLLDNRGISEICSDNRDGNTILFDNNTIRNLTGEYKKIEPDSREGVRAQLERMKELCKERDNLYEKQSDLKGKRWKIEKSLEL